MFSNMSPWKRWLPWTPVWTSPRAALREAAARRGASGETSGEDAPPCRRPDQAAKCFKLDYILLAFGLPKANPGQDMEERCKLCASIGSAEPWDCTEHWDQYRQWTR